MAISITNKTTGADNTSKVATGVYTTASVTPSSNKLQMFSVLFRGDDVAITTPTIAGCGLTWELVCQQRWDSVTPYRDMFTFRAMGASPSSGTITITVNGGSTTFEACWTLDEFTDMDTSGTNGSGAIVQYALGPVNTTPPVTATLNAFGSTNNATYGVCGNNYGSATNTVGSGFTQSGSTASSNNSDLLGEFKNTNDTTVDFTSDQTTFQHGVFGFEIKSSIVNVTKYPTPVFYPT